ncbi:MAG: hypothetical protein GY801_20545, partial [bacterium]|nr:hypothetical protein [bacterium]
MKNFTMYLGKLLVVFVCLVSTAYATLPSVSGKFQAPDKYGNILTDIPVNALTDAGYALGDVIRYAIDGDESHTAPFV